MKEHGKDRAFTIINTVLLVIFSLIMIYPMYFIIIASFSDPFEVFNGSVLLYPKGFSLEAYTNVFANAEIWTGYRNTIIYTLFGTLYNLVLTIPAAYVLTKKYLPFRKVLLWFFLITMYFGGGMIPDYLLKKSLGLINTPWVLIIGAGVSCYNLIVTRQFFESSTPAELYEAAEIDGASEGRSFFSIALPLAAPIIAVMALYYGVGHWNSYYSALLYVSDHDLYPLQLVLRNILINNSTSLATIDTYMEADEILDAARRAYVAASMKYAVIFIASAPLLMAYPFVQKYFVKGALIGSVKG